jgi:hypothetical protein
MGRQMIKYANYENFTLTIDAHRVANTLATDVGVIIRAFDESSDVTLSASLDFSESAGEIRYLSMQLGKPLYSLGERLGRFINSR